MEPYNEARPFYSKTMSNFFTELDEHCLDMEHEISFLKQKTREDHTEICNLHAEKHNAFNQIIGKTLMSCIDSTAFIDDPATATLIARIYEMPDIESVRAYIDTVRSNSLERIAK